jgi:drug/metabolite transporter (DMT)-like permease
MWFGFYNIALNEAERHIDAGTAAMLVNIGPLLIALLAGVLLHEGFPRPLVAGCAVAFVGVLLIGAATSHSGADAIGVVLSVTAAILYAAAVVTQKPLLARLPGLNVTWIACLIGVVTCLPFAPSLVHDLSHASGDTIWWIVYLGAFPTAIAFSTWAYALARSSAGKTGATTYLAPPIAILISWAFLNETPGPVALVGGVICLLGVYVARRPRRPARKAAVASVESESS